MYTRDIENGRDEFHALVEFTKTVRLGAFQRELRGGKDLRPDLILQAVNLYIVRQC